MVFLKQRELVRYNDALVKNGEYKAYHLIALEQLSGICYVYKYNDTNNPIDLLTLTTPDRFMLYINAQKCVKYDVDIINIVPLSEKYYAKNPTKN